ncbi:STAS domain-containing protein [Xinfangfangia sp. D13-10-4-6]|uniref:STAS domain-containing protein n=1 Tax=Pseudogemmobacter hezensis TaxID=2737662 RepID=UPI001552631B|nr:STAS domain-containing protein [Pseudogemmobacter hezensis]NPD17736.1 STAS domain-containing protein [Pseudogemmobacter hezensis]
MSIEAEVRDGVLVIHIGHDRIDAAGAIGFKERIRDLIPQAPPRVIMDLSAVNFVDSSGLGAIVAVMKLLAPERRLELAALRPAVEKVFRLTRIDSVFTIHPDIARGLVATG